MEYVRSIGHDGMVARISRFPLRCGAYGYLAELFLEFDSGDWRQFGVLGGREVLSAAQLLILTSQYLDRLVGRPVELRPED